MRRLFLSEFGCHDGTERLFAAALDTGVEPREVLYLTPSPRKLRDTQARFVRLVGRRALVPPLFRTTGQLCRDLHEQFGTARLFPSELKPLLVRRILTELRGPDAGRRPIQASNSASDRFGRRPVSIGYARVVSDFIANVKKHVRESDRPALRDRLLALLEGFATPLGRALEAAEALLVYDRELAARGWLDGEDVQAEAARRIGKDFRPPRVLILDSFVAPNRLEQALISALVGVAESVFALGYGAADDDPEYALAGLFTNAVRAGGGFSVEKLAGSGATSVPGFIRYPTLEDEISDVCRRIREGTGSRDLTETCIILPRLGEQSGLVSRILDRYQVPFTIYPDARLASSPPIVAVLELLTAIDTGFERVSTAASFSSPFLPGLLRLSGDSAPDQRNRAASTLSHCSRRAGIIKGESNWWSIGTRIVKSEQLDDDDPERPFLRDLQSRVRQALGLAGAMLEPADTLGSQAARLKAFLEAVEFCRSPDPTLDPELPAARRALYDILDSLAEFEQGFGAGRSAPGVPSESLNPEWGFRGGPGLPASDAGRSEFVRTVSYLIGLGSNAPDLDRGGVTVVSMEETLGLSPRALFFAGLTEADLPGPYRPDPILPDRVRRDLGMPDIDWHRDWQKFHFRRTLASSRTPPFLSCHESLDGRPVLPTPFLDLESVPAQPARAIHSEVERQLHEGRSAGVLFEQAARPVDFSTDAGVTRELAGRFGPDRAVSVTALEAYRRCPYRFYLERVLRIEAPPEPAFEIDSRQWGNIVHDALGRLYSGGAVPLSRVESAAGAALDEALKANALPLFWQQVTRRVFTNLLPRFVELERQLRDEGFEPLQTELALDGPVADTVRVSGRLDRVDSGPAGIRIIDYKTGSSAGVSARAVLEDRTHVQLPLYARLAPSRFPDRRVVNVGVYGLRDLRLVWLADDRHPVPDLVRAALETTAEVIMGIRAGRFPATPADDSTCRNCGLGFTCGRKLEGE
jgi:RecB family exonuclease